MRVKGLTLVTFFAQCNQCYCFESKVPQMYMVNKPIRVEYQPPGGGIGLTVGYEVLDETGIKDIINYPDAFLTEITLTIGSIYQGFFTPDEIGIWTVHVADSVGGLAVKQYVVTKDVEKLLSVPVMVA